MHSTPQQTNTHTTHTHTHTHTTRQITLFSEGYFRVSTTQLHGWTQMRLIFIRFKKSHKLCVVFLRLIYYYTGMEARCWKQIHRHFVTLLWGSGTLMLFVRHNDMGLMYRCTTIRHIVMGLMYRCRIRHIVMGLTYRCTTIRHIVMGLMYRCTTIRHIVMGLMYRCTTIRHIVLGLRQHYTYSVQYYYGVTVI